MHIRSLVAVAGTVTYCPAGQSVARVQAVALLADENVPAAQAVQTRSETAVPSVAMYEPGTQSEYGKQDVAGSPSLSQLPAAQTSGSGSSLGGSLVHADNAEAARAAVKSDRRAPIAIIRFSTAPDVARWPQCVQLEYIRHRNRLN
jgi:hypothetical protein